MSWLGANQQIVEPQISMDQTSIGNDFAPPAVAVLNCEFEARDHLGLKLVSVALQEVRKELARQVGEPGARLGCCAVEPRMLQQLRVIPSSALITSRLTKNCSGELASAADELVALNCG